MAIHVARFFPDRALEQLNASHGQNAAFIQTRITRQKIRREIASSLPLDSHGRDSNLEAARQELVFLRQTLSHDVTIHMAYVDCLAESSRLPRLKDRKHLFLKEAIEIIEDFKGKYLNDPHYRNHIYPRHAALIETTFAKAYALSYQRAKELNIITAKDFKSNGDRALKRAKTYVRNIRPDEQKPLLKTLDQIQAWLR